MKGDNLVCAKTFWQISLNSILEKTLSKFYAIFTSLNQFLLAWTNFY